MPKSILLFLMLTLVAFAQSDEGKKAPPATKHEPAQATPVVPPVAPVVPQGAPVLANQAQPYRQPSQAITIPQPFLMKSSDGMPFCLKVIGILGAPIASVITFLSVLYVQKNALKMMTTSHDNERSRDREERVANWKRELYGSLGQTVSSLSAGLYITRNHALRASYFPAGTKDHMDATDQTNASVATSAENFAKFSGLVMLAKGLLNSDAHAALEQFEKDWLLAHREFCERSYCDPEKALWLLTHLRGELSRSCEKDLQ